MWELIVTTVILYVLFAIGDERMRREHEDSRGD